MASPADTPDTAPAAAPPCQPQARAAEAASSRPREIPR